MKYGSVCSGIEAATVAWHPLGWEPAFFSEIDPFPSAVLAHRYPHVPNLGDFTLIRNKWLRRLGIEAIDLLVGGTPCQSFSVAGLRGGMADARGNLALEFLRLARRLRPAWVVWENVPGVLSSWTDEATSEATEECCGDVVAARRAVVESGINLGAEFGADAFEEVDQTNDFRCFLAGLEELGYGWAYRVLDAQNFGVPQRRRRVFVVGHLGGWRGPVAVLFERHSLSGNPPPCRTEREDIAGTLGGGSGERGWCDDLDRAGAFVAQAPSLTSNPYGDHESRHGLLVSGTLTCQYGEQSGNGLGSMTNGLIAHAPEVAFCLQSGSGRNEDGSRVGNAWNTNYVTHTLRGEGFDASEDGTGRGTPLVPVLAKTLTSHPDQRFDSDTETLVPVAFNPQAGGKQTSLGYNPGSQTTGTLSISQTPAIAFQCHGSNVGPMGTLRSGNGNETGGVPFVVREIQDVRTEGDGHRSDNQHRSGPGGDTNASNSDSGSSDDSVRSLSGVQAFVVNSAESCAKESHARASDTARCLDQTGGFSANQGGTVIAAFDPRNVTSNVNRTRVEPGLPCPTLHQQPMSIIGSGVRRLMPLECERLQGFPDNWTLIPYRGSPAADGPRYKAIGNSMAVPVMVWIGRRIAEVDSLLKR